jgi:hypothetical protein
LGLLCPILCWRFAADTAEAVAAAAEVRARAAGRDRVVEAHARVARGRAAARGRKRLGRRLRGRVRKRDRPALHDRRRIGPIWLLAPEAAGACRDQETSAGHQGRADPTWLRTGRRVEWGQLVRRHCNPECGQGAVVRGRAAALWRAIGQTSTGRIQARRVETFDPAPAEAAGQISRAVVRGRERAVARAQGTLDDRAGLRDPAATLDVPGLREGLGPARAVASRAETGQGRAVVSREETGPGPAVASRAETGQAPVAVRARRPAVSMTSSE